jgi:NitT/TauT family transport system substrate-binding protein
VLRLGDKTERRNFVRPRIAAQVFPAIVCFVVLLAARPEIASPAQPESFNMSYSALVPSGAPFWIGQDLKLFEREGLKTQLIYINSAARVMAAMLAGEVQIALSGVAGPVSALIQGSDPVAIAGAVNKLNVAIFVRPEIRSPQDLKGKRVGITRFGGLTDFAANYALKKWGLQPVKDVALIQIGDTSALVNALASNAIQAATLQPPFTIRAAQLGLRELVDLAKSDLEYQNTVVLTTRSLLRASPDAFRRFMRGFSGALAVFHNQRDASLKVMARYLKGLDPVILEKSYEAYKAWVPEIPYLNQAGMTTAIELTPAGGKEKLVKYGDIVDESLVRELEQQGFYRALYKK